MKTHEIDSSRTISPDIQIACRQKAREAYIQGYIRIETTTNNLYLRPGPWIKHNNS